MFGYLIDYSCQLTASFELWRYWSCRLILVEPVGEVLLEERSLGTFVDAGYVGPVRVPFLLNKVLHEKSKMKR